MLCKSHITLWYLGIGNTKSPVIHPGNIPNIAITIFSVGNIINNNIDITTPTENNIKSNGLNILNIKVPLLAFDGTKYPFI